MNKQSIRDIFDIISLNVIGFLENHIGISDVDFVERSGVAEMSITKWEEENAPFQQRADARRELLPKRRSAGLVLSHRAARCDQHLGLMHVVDHGADGRHGCTG